MSESGLWKRVLDPCCGSRMWWFNKSHSDVVYSDIRHQLITVTDRSHGKEDGIRRIYIEPDIMADFRKLPFPDESFYLVAFDPPHLVRAGKNSWLGAKYGTLTKDWKEDLRKGFTECFRVLKPSGVLIFKWSEVQVKISEILPLVPISPLFGNTAGKREGTHWMVFMKGGE